MTKADLLSIIANRENSVVKFKNDAVEPHRVARQLVGFLNTYGGSLLLGVEDDGSVSGTKRSNIGEWVTTLCRDKIRPEVIPMIETLRKVEPGKDITVVRVEQGYAVHHLWHNNHRTYFVRANDQTREASPEELQMLFQRRGALRAELGAVSGSNIKHLDLNRLERMRIGCRAARNQLIKDTMRDYGYLEHMGMGIPRKMFAAMAETGLPDPVLEVGEESLRVVLHFAKT